MTAQPARHRFPWRRHVASAGVLSLLAGGLVLTSTQVASASDWTSCLAGSTDRQATFERASAVSGVPTSVLLGVSYLQSRWDDHGSSPSTSGGYGPMHLTELPSDTALDGHADGKGDDGHGHQPVTPSSMTGSPGVDQDRASLETLKAAAALIDVPAGRLRTDDVANICGGAALLASYQAEEAPESTEATRPEAWTAAVAKYSGAADRATALRFTERVFEAISTGRTRTTNDGHRVTLRATPAQVDEAAVRSMDLVVASTEGVDCPAGLGCESIPAPYEQYGDRPIDYGNHDLADREQDMDIDYIIIHDTEATWNTTLNLVTRPDYLAWHYSLRSSDGHIAQHLDNKDVGWHAGNWYVNMHSIGLEHEGFAAEGASWYTELMYQTSAELVRYLAAKYGVPLDRAHIIGHDQIPGTTPSTVRGMHWDPGPYWDWEHYMDLLGAPIQADRRDRSDVVTVAPGYEGNAQPITGCGEKACESSRANFVYLHTAPSEDSPLVKDIGLRPNGAPSTTHVSDIGARAAAGHKFLVAQRSGDWIGVWYLGDVAWLRAEDLTGESNVRPSHGKVVVAAGEEPVPVYGRAYPEASAYPASIPVQAIVPLQYTIKPGQAYVLADETVETDYYYAKTYDCASLTDDCTQVVGRDKYYEIWFGHRMAFVKAADVRVKDGVARLL